MSSLRVDIVTNIPTPYNQALFSNLARRVDLRVHYLGVPAGEGRSWIGTFTDGYEFIMHSGSYIPLLGWWNPLLARKGIGRPTDVVILSGSYLSPSVSALALRRNSHLKLFWGEQFGRRNTFVGARHLSRLLRRCDAALVVGEKAAQGYRNVASCPVHVFPYTAELARTCSLGAAGVVGYCGQLIDRKGVDLLLRGVSRVGGSSVEVIGSGPAEDHLRRLAGSLNIDVRWLGEQPNDQLSSLCSHWTCQVLASRYDGWGVVVNEALAAGRPVVVSDAVGAAELIRPGLNGWIASAGHVGSLARQIRAALTAGCHRGVRRGAAGTGELFSSSHAAGFLHEVLQRPEYPRSFLEEQWERYDQNSDS